MFILHLENIFENIAMWKDDCFPNVTKNKGLMDKLNFPLP